MPKISINASCPCGSGDKYKKCCRIYHQGAKAPDALTLMKTRYSAYAANEYAYIIKTTHPKNPDYSIEMQTWKTSILAFSNHTEFLGLEIIEFIDTPHEAFATFTAHLSSGILNEKSRFLKTDGKWLYVDGVLF